MLFRSDNLLPKDTLIWGFARSSLTDNDLRDRLRPNHHILYLLDNDKFARMLPRRIRSGFL